MRKLCQTKEEYAQDLRTKIDQYEFRLWQLNRHGNGGSFQSHRIRNIILELTNELKYYEQ